VRYTEQVLLDEGGESFTGPASRTSDVPKLEGNASLLWGEILKTLIEKNTTLLKKFARVIGLQTWQICLGALEMERG
jgi:hypothetical protein